MIMKGQKRKLPPEDMEVSDSGSVTWESQRQFVFSVSLSKYQHGQELAEPSLRRSVLIANTLRQMEACTGPSINCETSPPNHSPHPGDAADSSSTFDKSNSAFPRLVLSNCASSRSAVSSSSHALTVPPSLPEEEEDWGLMSTDPDFSLSAAVDSILTVLDSAIDSGPHATPRMPLRSVENLLGSSEEGVSRVVQRVRGSGRCWEQQQQQGEESRAREADMEWMRSSYLGDSSVDDMFQDIDTSLLERDMGILGLRGGGGEDLLRYLPPLLPTTSSAHPLSFSLNQNIKCLPSFSSFSPHFLSLPPSAATTGQSQGLELEHLMEILVES